MDVTKCHDCQAKPRCMPATQSTAASPAAKRAKNHGKQLKDVMDPSPRFHHCHTWESITVRIQIRGGKGKQNIQNVGTHALTRAEHLRNIFEQCGHLAYLVMMRILILSDTFGTHGLLQNLKHWAGMFKTKSVSNKSLSGVSRLLCGELSGNTSW